MRRFMAVAMVLLAWLACAQATARAQGAPPAPQQNPAEQRFKAGLDAYNIGDFDTAITEWKEAYRLAQLPDLLVNIAQAYRGKGDHTNAVFFLNSYLRARPDAPNAAEVTALRDEEQRLLDDERAARTAQLRAQEEARRAAEADAARTSAAATTDVTAAVPTDGGPRPGRGLRVAGLIAGGAGILLVGTGILFEVSASGTADELEAASARGDLWTDALADKESAGERKATMGAVFIGVGAAAVVGGAVSYVIGWRKGREHKAAPVATVLPTGTGVVALVRF